MVKTIKSLLLVILMAISLCLVNTPSAISQESIVVYISPDGSVYSETMVTIPIERDGNMYTFTDDIFVTALVIQRGDITIDGNGYNLQGEGEVGLQIAAVNGVTIKNLQIRGIFYYGIYIVESSDNIIQGNTITNNGRGIYLYNATRNTISDNSIMDNEIGIDMLSTSNNILRNNNIENNFNLAVFGDELSHFLHDIDSTNIVNGKKAYYLINEQDLTINQNTYPDIGFLGLVNCNSITVQDLGLTNNGQGIIVAFTTGSTIIQNSITDNYNGILLFSASNNIVVDNVITNNYRGIQFSNASNSNQVTNNDITNNNNGIFLFDSTQNAISENNITDNKIGLGFKLSSNNRIWGNYFINNDRQVDDSARQDASILPSLNFWDLSYQLGGNYWSDYYGVDIKSGNNQDQEGSDGKGDTPYTVYLNNQDKYPLMPFGSPPGISISSPQNKTYSFTDVKLDFEVSETTSWIKYSLDGNENVTITEDITLSGLSEGSHYIIVYAEDPDGMTGVSETIFFTIAPGAGPAPSEISPYIWIVIGIGIVIAVIVLIYFFIIRKK